MPLNNEAVNSYWGTGVYFVHMFLKFKNKNE